MAAASGNAKQSVAVLVAASGLLPHGPAPLPASPACSVGVAPLSIASHGSGGKLQFTYRRASRARRGPPCHLPTSAGLPRCDFRVPTKPLRILTNRHPHLVQSVDLRPPATSTSYGWRNGTGRSQTPPPSSRPSHGRVPICATCSSDCNRRSRRDTSAIIFMPKFDDEYYHPVLDYLISASRCLGAPLCSALQPREFQTRLTFPAVKEIFLQVVRYACQYLSLHIRMVAQLNGGCIDGGSSCLGRNYVFLLTFKCSN
nr:uncharacterized protein LOC127328566 [Lolium perenne]